MKKITDQYGMLLAEFDEVKHVVKYNEYKRKLTFGEKMEITKQIEEGKEMIEMNYENKNSEEEKNLQMAKDILGIEIVKQTQKEGILQGPTEQLIKNASKILDAKNNPNKENNKIERKPIKIKVNKTEEQKLILPISIIDENGRSFVEYEGQMYPTYGQGYDRYILIVGSTKDLMTKYSNGEVDELLYVYGHKHIEKEEITTLDLYGKIYIYDKEIINIDVARDGYIFLPVIYKSNPRMAMQIFLENDINVKLYSLEEAENKIQSTGGKSMYCQHVYALGDKIFI